MQVLLREEREKQKLRSEVEQYEDHVNEYLCRSLLKPRELGAQKAAAKMRPQELSKAQIFLAHTGR